AKVQYLRPHLVVVEVVEGEMIGQTLVESSKSDGGPDAAGADDGEVPHPLSMSVSGGLLTVGEVGIGDSSDDYPYRGADHQRPPGVVERQEADQDSESRADHHAEPRPHPAHGHLLAPSLQGTRRTGQSLWSRQGLRRSSKGVT